jgi:hypothetical protein
MTQVTQRVTAQNGLDPWQYRLSNSRTAGSCAIGKFWLDLGEDLPKTQIFDAAGTPVGVILGLAIDLQTETVLGESWTATQILGSDVDGFARHVLYGLGGRYIWICATTVVGQDIARIYPDAAAQIPCVFDPAAQVAGSTALAILSEADYDRRFDRALFDRLGVDGEGWFPAGLTAHHGVMRLMSGHYLDLVQGKAVRFWPTSALPVGDDAAGRVEEIIALVRSQMKALLKGSKRVAMALTAGRETRMLLACARPFVAQVDFVTVTGDDRHKIDSLMAQRIARDLGLSHMILPRQAATPEQRSLFIRRGGHCNADSNSRYHPSVWPLAKGHIFVGGVGGEIARAFFWRPSDTPTTPLTAAMLCGRFGLPMAEPLVAAVQAWLDQAPPGLNTQQLLDLAYHEHRTSAWSSVQFCCDPTVMRLGPLMTYRGLDLMLGLAPEWKRASRLADAITSRLWPELETYPYNSLGRWSDLVVKLQRVLDDPKIILKKLRKMRH